MTSSDWATVASLATALGTLVLAIATFAAVRSANRAARATERALLAGIRPVLMPSRQDDADQKVGFADNRWLKLSGGRAVVDVTDDAVYLAISLRNVGSGLAVLDRWSFHAERILGDASRPEPADFRRLTRDLYVAAGDVGFWQGAFRDAAEPEFAAVRDAARRREQMTVDLLYGDHEGGQRTITRFAVIPDSHDGWLAAVGRHWNLDRSDPR
jgi:hypothetical protein